MNEENTVENNNLSDAAQADTAASDVAQADTAASDAAQADTTASDAAQADPSASCDSACSSCAESCSSRTAPAMTQTNEQANIKHAIAVVSGKGGVGKSMVTSLIATSLNRRGYNIGILDADITGPSIPKAFGISGRISFNEYGIVPRDSEKGIKIVSANLILPADTAPVIWRGPVISGMVKQFYSDVAWGDIDYLLIDMPPGTGDVPLTVYQSIQIDGVIVVTAPQDLVSMIVGKAINMARMMKIPVLGIVENMSFFKCPDCGSNHEVFGTSRIEEIAEEYEIDLIAQIPIQPNAARYMDKGKVEDMLVEELDPFVTELITKTA